MMNCLVCAVVELLNNIPSLASQSLLAQKDWLARLQHTYVKKPLSVAVCYRCGHMLWSCVDGAHTFLVSKPSGMSEEEAPASAYLRAVPNCVAGFVYTERGKSTKDTVSSIAITAHTHTHTHTHTQ